MKGTTMSIDINELENQEQIEAEIMRRRLARFEISDDEWQRGLDQEYQDQKQFESMIGQI